ncbi:MAG: amidase family protein [Nonlabens sp.]
MLDSKYINKDEIFQEFQDEVNSLEMYEEMAPLVLERSIPEIQEQVMAGAFNHYDLTLFYLARIYKYDRENDQSLNSVISLNSECLVLAHKADDVFEDMTEDQREKLKYSVHGMPILLKDNIDVDGMVTTAGAAVMFENTPMEDAQVTNNIKKAGEIILRKANLSEWAYYFCGDCPSGYSAIGGQTLNPYGRKTIDTGGSSSGSGVTVAANFAVAALGSETAGSIISPASQNSVVGFKPGMFVEGRGVVPISSYLDRVGPMTKNVIDNVIINSVLYSEPLIKGKVSRFSRSSVDGKRIGVYSRYMENEHYKAAINLMRENGAVIVELEAKELELPGFLTILDADMKNDLTSYFKESAEEEYNDWTIENVIENNKKSPEKSMPYGQKLFEKVAKNKTLENDLKEIKVQLLKNAQEYFSAIESLELDSIASINNYDAAVAAVGMNSLLTVPMGYDEKGQPLGLTFIGISGKDQVLYEIATAFERLSNVRKMPKGFN